MGRLGKEGERTYTALGYSGCEVDGGGGRGSGRSGGGGGHGGGGKDGQGGVDAELHVVWCLCGCLVRVSKKVKECVVSKVWIGCRKRECGCLKVELEMKMSETTREHAVR